MSVARRVCQTSPFRANVGLGGVSRWTTAAVQVRRTPRFALVLRARERNIIARRWNSSIASTPTSTATVNTTPGPPPDSPSPPPRRRSLALRLAAALVLGTLTFTLGFTMAAAPALSVAQDFLNPPTDEETLTLFTPSTPAIAEIEQNLFSHPLTQSLLSDPRYTASRPHLKIPPGMRSQSLTGGTLLGEDKIAVPPLQFTTSDGSTYFSLQWVGGALCGHPGMVHGGLLATLLDEGLARCCFPALPNKVGVTASLTVEYKKPTLAGQVLVLRAQTTRVEGRKAWVKGSIETLPREGEERGEVLVEAEALFIEPRGAKSMRRVVN
ncbi:hypothetical protein EJ04DRAFT_492042 [Polyplosphaeria fusca]|uniref:Thioesterase domain-containing protein n=1 Tax=Polyplosphaeria fusca TaxID=682080 RepID=A0A9P4R1R8_9PLEO|nr:hypothetical protein EJ04DRAFT_492042 [Polyplosphaeria fusca]